MEKKDPNELLDFLNEQVSPHKQIHHVEVLDVLPRNHAGKVMRHELARREKIKAGLLTE
jgi:acyl-coenzyme A synthetase/AMP-(fatty) acid ligase